MTDRVARSPGEVQKHSRLRAEAVLCWIIAGAVILNAQAQVCGMPALVLRRLLRRTMHDFWTRKVVARELKISLERASRLISALQEHAYVEPVPTEHRGTWRNTTLGNSFANATAARPVKRRVAERRLSEFLNRVRRVNAKPTFLYRVTEVVVFGSYLPVKSKMGDVDLAIHLEPKPEFRDGWAERVLAHAAEAEARAAGSRVLRPSGKASQSPVSPHYVHHDCRKQRFHHCAGSTTFVTVATRIER